MFLDDIPIIAGNNEDLKQMMLELNDTNRAKYEYYQNQSDV